jgi:U1 small nuclear ribonucleoprotein
MAYKLEKEIASWKPEKNPKATRDPYKTIFVGRLSYDTDESKLKHVFGWYGKIKQVDFFRHN